MTARELLYRARRDMVLERRRMGPAARIEAQSFATSLAKEIQFDKVAFAMGWSDIELAQRRAANLPMLDVLYGVGYFRKDT